MFTDAMSMLGDPSAVKEAEAMMNDPEFKAEINQYMETLKSNPVFQQAMSEAQRKYQVRGSRIKHGSWNPGRLGSVHRESGGG